jgi:hypothetical protein
LYQEKIRQPWFPPNVVRWCYFSPTFTFRERLFCNGCFAVKGIPEPYSNHRHCSCLPASLHMSEGNRVARFFYFEAQNPNWVKFSRVLNIMDDVGILYGHLVYFTVIWYSL